MPYATTSDNVRLHYEEAGGGSPILFLHEFAADHTNWEPQMPRDPRSMGEASASLARPG